jgi:hypothetical protein
MWNTRECNSSPRRGFTNHEVYSDNGIRSIRGQLPWHSFWTSLWHRPRKWSISFSLANFHWNIAEHTGSSCTGQNQFCSNPSLVITVTNVQLMLLWTIPCRLLIRSASMVTMPSSVDYNRWRRHGKICFAYLEENWICPSVHGTWCIGSGRKAAQSFAKSLQQTQISASNKVRRRQQQWRIHTAAGCTLKSDGRLRHQGPQPEGG